MRFVFEITAKVETGRLDGSTQFAFQGRLTVLHDDLDMQGEPLQMGLVVTAEMFGKFFVGDTLTFEGSF